LHKTAIQVFYDQIDVEEHSADVLGITIGQRYSVLVTARNDTSANWAIHANLDPDMYDYVPDNLIPSKLAPCHSYRDIFSYSFFIDVTSSITYNHSAPVIDYGPISSYPLTNDSAFVPVEPIAAPAATKTIELEVTFDKMSDGTNRGMFNKVTYNRPLVPALFSELTMGANSTSESAYGPTSFVLEHGGVVDLIVKNGDDGDHPL